MNNFSSTVESVQVKRLKKFGAVDIIERAARRIQEGDDMKGEVVEDNLMAGRDAGLSSRIQERKKVAGVQGNYQGMYRVSRKSMV